jgi:hypothetical protein
MALLYIDEYYAAVIGGIQAPVCPPIVVQTPINFGDGAAHQSAPFSNDTKLIEVSVDAICSVLVGGKNPVATTNNMRWPAGKTCFFIVRPGDALSVIVNV